ncbi:MAG TPA: hypothetical protein ENL20_04755, partial [Candidatus Cloacimonetes bacterium]|nr:hypothetical protein [Candidatus Cloacimonadota bacterium]
LLDIEKTFSFKKFETQKDYLDYRKDEIPEKYVSFFKYNRTEKSIERNLKNVSEYIFKAGYFVLLTNSNKFDKYSILEHYRNRDIVEKMFDIEKNHLDTKRLRSHSDLNVRGRLFIKFIALILYSYMYKTMQNGLFRKYSVKELLAELSKIQYAKINGENIYSEISKSQRKILKHFEITPKMITKT